MSSGNFPVIDGPVWEREKLLLIYQNALERGDLDAQEAVLQAAGDAPDFAEAVWELHLALGAEAEAMDVAAAEAASQAEATQVRTIAATALSAPVVATHAEAEALLGQEGEGAATAETELPPLTLRDVAARIRQDVERGLVAVRDRATALRAARQIEAAARDEELADEHLTRRGARALLGRLNLGAAGAWFEKLFHDAVLDLTMAREQDSFRLAAARRTRGRPDSRPAKPNEVRPQDEQDEKAARE